MKAFVALAVLAIAQATGVAAGVDDVKGEFLRWKASAAGQLAYKNGFVPSSSSSSPSSSKTAMKEVATKDEPTHEELARFENALNEVARIQELQPHATFSVDTPFALLTKAEFEEHVGKGGAQEHLAALQKQIAARPLLVDGGVPAAAASTAVNASAPVATTMITTMNNATRKLDTWFVNVDWQTNGCVTRVKDQGRCSVCWAFSSVGALESGNCARGGGLVELSEQTVTSCTFDKPTCGKALGPDVFDWLSRLNGGSICTAASYPYTSGGGSTSNCKLYDPAFQCDKPNLGAYFYNGGNFADHTQLEAAVLKQPVAASVHCAWQGFQYYKGGMLMGNEQYCPADKTDHEVLIVGFGTLNGIPYWKVKNQWSESWGDHGYMYIERGYQGHTFGACGIENYAYYPVFTSASDARLNRRASTPRWGFVNVGQVYKVVTGAWKGEQCASRCLQEAGCVAFNFYNANRCELLSSTTRILSGLGYSGTINAYDFVGPFPFARVVAAEDLLKAAGAS
ncbi:hypothetical protein PybrP1_002159 [[Pythium] brassicae (nom. inval.)]|nr:hypothetical protein PybrP1_002159 [[Pythium] brassicae (nom. inval.)]